MSGMWKIIQAVAKKKSDEEYTGGRAAWKSITKLSKGSLETSHGMVDNSSIRRHYGIILLLMHNPMWKRTTWQTYIKTSKESKWLNFYSTLNK